MIFILLTLSVLEVANKEYGDFSQQLTNAAKDDRWRLNSNFIADQFHSSFQHFQIEGDKTAVCRNNSNESKELHIPPSEWTRFLLLVGRCRIHYYRDWVRLMSFDLKGKIVRINFYRLLHT